MPSWVGHSGSIAAARGNSFSARRVLGCIPTRNFEYQLLPISVPWLHGIAKVHIAKLLRIEFYYTRDVSGRIRAVFSTFFAKKYFSSFLPIWPTMGHIGSHNTRGKQNQQNLKKRIYYIYIVLSIFEKFFFCFTTFVHTVDRAYTNGLLT